MRPLLPAFHHVFHLDWSDIEAMPHAELEAHVDYLNRLKGG